MTLARSDTAGVRRLYGPAVGRRTIDPDDPEDLHHWALTFGATEDGLRAAIVQVGTDVIAVGDFLQSSEASRNSERGEGPLAFPLHTWHGGI